MAGEGHRRWSWTFLAQAAHEPRRGEGWCRAFSDTARSPVLSPRCTSDARVDRLRRLHSGEGSAMIASFMTARMRYSGVCGRWEHLQRAMKIARTMQAADRCSRIPWVCRAKLMAAFANCRPSPGMAPRAAVDGGGPSDGGVRFGMLGIWLSRSYLRAKFDYWV